MGGVANCGGVRTRVLVRIELEPPSEGNNQPNKAAGEVIARGAEAVQADQLLAIGEAVATVGRSENA